MSPVEYLSLAVLQVSCDLLNMTISLIVKHITPIMKALHMVTDSATGDLQAGNSGAQMH